MKTRVQRFQYKLAAPKILLLLTFVLLMKAPDGNPEELAPYTQTLLYTSYTVDEFKTRKMHLSFNKLLYIIKGTCTRTCLKRKHTKQD
jgi:hypothetical protein